MESVWQLLLFSLRIEGSFVPKRPESPELNRWTRLEMGSVCIASSCLAEVDTSSVDLASLLAESFSCLARLLGDELSHKAPFCVCTSDNLLFVHLAHDLSFTSELSSTTSNVVSRSASLGGEFSLSSDLSVSMLSLALAVAITLGAGVRGREGSSVVSSSLSFNFSA